MAVRLFDDDSQPERYQLVKQTFEDIENDIYRAEDNVGRLEDLLIAARSERTAARKSFVDYSQRALETVDYFLSEHKSEDKQINTDVLNFIDFVLPHMDADGGFIKLVKDNSGLFPDSWRLKRSGYSNLSKVINDRAVFSSGSSAYCCLSADKNAAEFNYVAEFKLSVDASLGNNPTSVIISYVDPTFTSEFIETDFDEEITTPDDFTVKWRDSPCKCVYYLDGDDDLFKILISGDKQVTKRCWLDLIDRPDFQTDGLFEKYKRFISSSKNIDLSNTIRNHLGSESILDSETVHAHMDSATYSCTQSE